MHSRKILKGAGIAFLTIGIAFMALAFTGQPAFPGVGAAFLPLGIVFLAKSRKDQQP